MSSVVAVHKGVAAEKPTHRFTNHGGVPDKQSRSADCAAYVLDHGGCTPPPSDMQARRGRIARELAAADAVLGPATRRG
ncbi:hypothetical protein E4U42_005942 [Claviceps africana]|uniref:Uncharacterized protein n=1 Tax=Claviceps africana TaxID=83212 RepID=A0A8K0J322_9HYPO|nr:hypothetical protein E4U42_005942 [Claviceps africana]